MSKSLAEANEESRIKYDTKNNNFHMFPVGTKVKIICSCQDFNFFYGEKGEVIKNDGGYLGIRVEFDKPRHFEDGQIQRSFNFAPDDLSVVFAEYPNKFTVMVGQ